MVKQKESDIQANTPVPLFVVDGTTYAVPLLAICAADKWLDRTEEIGQLELNIRSASNAAERTEAKRAFRQAIYDCVFSYNPEALPREEIEGKVSTKQMVDAYYLLKELTDPFEQLQAKALADVRKQMEGLPSTVVQRALSSIQ